MNLNFLNKIDKRIVFVSLLIVISLIYNYHNIFFYKPQSVHNWRQADCASITLNYYQNGMKFFQPEVHALMSNGYTTNEAATSEMPILYYTVALLYKIFGVHESIYRILNTLIFLFGLYSLFRIMEKFKLNRIWSFSLSLLFFASPILVYYGNNFLTDCSAFAFALAGWNYFISYYQKGRMKDFMVSMIFFFFAMSFKVFAGISVLTLLAIYFFDLFKIIKFKSKGRVFQKWILQLIPFFVIFLIVGAWILYARNYNIKYQCPYFSTTKIYPFWSISKEEISVVWEHIRILWLDQFYHPYTLILFLVMFLYNLVNIRKTNKLLITSNIIIFLGFILYCGLFFTLFKDHDCYTINLYILLVITALTSAEYINRRYPKFAQHILVKIFLVLVLGFNVYHTQSQMHGRYNGWWNEYPRYKDFYTIKPYLRSIGITKSDTVISLPDASHHTLYLMNQKGWTLCFGQNKDSTGIATSIQNGAKYLIVSTKDVIEDKPYIKPFILDTLGKYNEAYIYNLK